MLNSNIESMFLGKILFGKHKYDDSSLCLLDNRQELLLGDKVSYTIESVVKPILSAQDKKHIEDSNLETEKLNIKSAWIHYTIGGIMGGLGVTSVIFSAIKDFKGMRFDHVVDYLIVGILMIGGGTIVMLLRNKYNNFNYRQKIYRKYPEAQKILADLKAASELLNKTSDPKNYQK
jgi:hypothetical protein